MSLSVFVDTSAWIALINKSDVFHLKAKTIRDVLIKDKRQFFVTDYVVVEIANSLSRIPWRSGSSRRGSGLRFCIWLFRTHG
jgi:predicted nucleic acid-binding protein